MELAEIDASAWAELEAATANPESGFRYVSLCSVDPAAKPQARMVVLRRTDIAARILEFHTDTRSPKWQEFSANPHATVLTYDTQARLQLRLRGRVELHGPGSDLAHSAWQRQPPWTRSSYAGGPPGDELAFEAMDGPVTADEAKGQARFGVLVFRAATLDWFQLRRNDNRRAWFSYDATGSRVACRWVNP